MFEDPTDMLDLSGPKHNIQVELRDDGKVMWVSVDGETVLRISNIKVPVEFKTPPKAPALIAVSPVRQEMVFNVR